MKSVIRSGSGAFWRVSAVALVVILTTAWVGCGGNGDDAGESGDTEGTDDTSQLQTDESDMTMVSLKVPNMV
jgi:hypothetical protein